MKKWQLSEATFLAIIGWFWRLPLIRKGIMQPHPMASGGDI